MSSFRLIILFVYAFSSMIVPVGLLLIMNELSSHTLTFWITNNLSIAITIIMIYALVQLAVIFPKITSWAATVEPKNVEPVKSEVLRARLFELNNDKIPFLVEQDPKNDDKLKASWKIADEKWIELFAARKIKIQYELKMKLDEQNRTVKAQDNFRKFEYVAGLNKKGIRFESTYSFFKGISLFQYEKGKQYGLIYKDGKIKIDYAYNYCFDISEIKNPIIDVISDSGWRFKPSLFLR